MDEWSVYLEAEAPEGEHRDPETMFDAAARVLDQLAGHGPVATADARSWNVYLTVEAATPFEAGGLARTLIAPVLARVGLPLWPYVHCEATRWDRFTADLAAP